MALRQQNKDWLPKSWVMKTNELVLLTQQDNNDRLLRRSIIDIV